MRHAWHTNETGPPRNGVTPPVSARGVRSVGDLDDVLRRGALLAVHDVELHAIPLSERLESAPLDRREMDETVLLTLFGGDEAEALRVVEPLDLSGSTHSRTLPLLMSSESSNAAPTD